MPSADFLSFMSRDFTKLLENKDECNVTIKVGLKAKPYRAHSVILRARSPYFQKFLTRRNADVTLNKWVVKLPNVSPIVFELILRYIYGGNIILEQVDTEIVLAFLATAGFFHLEDLYDHLQDYLLEGKTDWLREHIIATCRVAGQNVALKKLRRFCKKIKEREPDLIFNSVDFASFEEKSLVRLLQRDDLGMEEIDIWDRLIKWGTENTPQQPRVRRSSGPNFEAMEKTLHRCIPHIRFFHISAADFHMKVRPWKNIMPPTLYSDLFRFHVDPKYKPITKRLEARHGAIESEIISMRQAALISSWIDRKDCESETSFRTYKAAETPYEFQLLLRGSQAGFTAKAFHEHCDNKGPNVVLMKVQNSTEIIGAYNPLHWESNLIDLATTESFLFSMPSKADDNPNHAVLSRVKSPKHAIVCAPDNGPTFGAPYAIAMRDNFDDPEKTGCCGGTSASYNVSLRSPEERYFWVEDYEVFQITRRQEFHSSPCEREPDLIFNSVDFASFEEKSLVRLLQRDDLGMEEIDIWDRLIKWGTENTPQQPRVRRSSGPNFEAMEKTLHRCIPHIRFFHISAADFHMKVRPWKNIMPPTLYSDLFRFHVDPKYKPITKRLEARHGAIESEIISMRQAALISSWIDRKDCESETSFRTYKAAETPYEFQLLLRGSQAGFTAKAFHEHCDNKGPNVVLMKVQNSTEIIGAYNPLHWESNLIDLATTESFLFSMPSKADDNPNHAVLSRVKSPKHAIVCAPDNGPTFGAPYAIAMRDNFDDPEKTGCCGGTSASYNVSLRSPEERYFWVEDYEVFQITRRQEFHSSPCVGK
ncbi:hypothetical protein G9A89_009760 [Geosiphon pyriformis]|nr:hypothetical protein G9A89_009760 [Geosiphon pyriformis]